MIFFFEYEDMHDDILSRYIGVVVNTQVLSNVITHNIKSKIMWNWSFILQQYKWNKTNETKNF